MRQRGRKITVGLAVLDHRRRLLPFVPCAQGEFRLVAPHREDVWSEIVSLLRSPGIVSVAATPMWPMSLPLLLVAAYFILLLVFKTVAKASFVLDPWSSIGRLWRS